MNPHNVTFSPAAAHNTHSRRWSDRANGTSRAGDAISLAFPHLGHDNSEHGNVTTRRGVVQRGSSLSISCTVRHVRANELGDDLVGSAGRSEGERSLWLVTVIAR